MGCRPSKRVRPSVCQLLAVSCQPPFSFSPVAATLAGATETFVEVGLRARPPQEGPNSDRFSVRIEQPDLSES
jgi:hypothetical protein